MEFKPERGESWWEFLGRIEKFTKGLYERYGNNTLLISTHGFVARCFLSIYLNIPIEELIRLHTRNTGILIIDVNKDGARKVKDEMFIYPDGK